MRPRKIAVCLSAQTRTWKTGVESLKHYFSSTIHEVKFFGHTWDENSWKTIIKGQRTRVNEKLSAEKLEAELRAAIPLEALVIDRQITNEYNGKWKGWIPMLKSAAIANHLKTRYEVENNMEFDVVVKTRWDVAYPTMPKFEVFINDYFNPCVLYCHVQNNFVREFRFPSFDDIMYFGSSRVMDIMDGFFSYYTNDKFLELVRGNHLNLAHDMTGCGPMLHKWATLHNIALINPLNFVTPPVIRKDAEELKWPADYPKIVTSYNAFKAT